MHMLAYINTLLFYHINCPSETRSLRGWELLCIYIGVEKDHTARLGFHVELTRDALGHASVFTNLPLAWQEARPREVGNWSQVPGLGRSRASTESWESWISIPCQLLRG